MIQKAEKSGKTLTAVQSRAAILVADDELTDEAISAELGITSRTLRNWKDRPVFQAAVAEHRARIAASISRFWVAKRRKRVKRLQELADAAISVIEQRAADPTLADVPGGTTGLMLRDVKVVGTGEDAERVDMYRVDTALMAEIRNTLKQAAQEVGDWTEKREVGLESDAELTQVVFVMPVKGSKPPIYIDGEEA